MWKSWEENQPREGGKGAGQYLKLLCVNVCVVLCFRNKVSITTIHTLSLKPNSNPAVRETQGKQKALKIQTHTHPLIKWDFKLLLEKTSLLYSWHNLGKCCAFANVIPNACIKNKLAAYERNSTRNCILNLQNTFTKRSHLIFKLYSRLKITDVVLRLLILVLKEYYVQLKDGLLFVT